MSIERSSTMIKQNKIVLLDIDDTMFNTALLKKTDLTMFKMYEEVHDALEELAQVASLGIFSQGEIAFQLKKLKETNIHNYFAEEHTHIVADKLEVIRDILEKYADKGKIYIVEDRLDVLQIAKQCGANIYTIWMKRGRYADKQRVPVVYIPDATVRNLHEVVPVIKEH
jgi:FMN phosphatase YigB (HAD superfamily)